MYDTTRIGLLSVEGTNGKQKIVIILNKILKVHFNSKMTFKII